MHTNPRNCELSELVREYKKGDLELPLMQREYVWKPRKARMLFDSLRKGYPIGAFYLWKSEKRQLTRSSSGQGRLLLLDPRR